MSEIILYTYPESPFGQKLTRVLVLKQLKFSLVAVPRVPPRSALLSLGITYRRIPVLAIGNDLFLDTSLAVLALERTFPAHPLSTSSWGVQTASSFFWSDRAIFKVAASLIPWDKMSDDFVKDRASYSGVVALDPNAIVKNRPAAESALRSHLTVIETQLAQRTLSSNFILDTPTPTYLDLSLSFPLYWVTSFGTAPHLLISFPLISAWLPLLTSHIKTFKNSHPTKGIPQRLSPEDAARIIHATLPDERESKVEEEEPLIREKWLRLGSEVEVTPDDSGKVPQKGTLVALNSEQSVIEVVASGGKCRIHAPRLGFTIRSSRK